MRPAKFAHAADQDWAGLAKSLSDQLTPEGPNGATADETLGFLYVTDYMAGDIASILTFLRERTGIEIWVGSVGIGICGTGRSYFDRPAAVALALPVPAHSCRLASVGNGAQTRFSATDILREITPGLGVFHGDPRNPDTPELIAKLSEQMSCFLVGGLTASRSEYTQIAGKITEGGLSGVFVDASVPVVTGLSQGCAPIGPARSIDDCSEEVVCALDGKLAKDAIEEDIGLRIDDEAFMAAVQDVHVALLVPGSDTGDYLVRDLTGIDPESGWLAIGGEPATGNRLMFCRRNADAAEQDLLRMLEDIRQRADASPRAGLFHSCVARGPNLFENASRELELISQTLGDFPLVGFFGNGEISHNRLYGYTGVLTLFL